MWSMSDFRGRARQTTAIQQSMDAVGHHVLAPAVSDPMHTQVDDFTLQRENTTTTRSMPKPSRSTVVGSASSIPREAAAFELCRRTDGQSRPLVSVPPHLRDRMKDFPALEGFYEYTPLGQANILILQLADRIHALEQRINLLETERLTRLSSEEKREVPEGVQIEGGRPTS